jgi:hypothetical protein
MTPQELNLVKQFAANSELKNAVKQYILEDLEPSEWLHTLNTNLDDAEYGQIVKVRVRAKKELTEAFERMKFLLEKKEPPKVTNEAR